MVRVIIAGSRSFQDYELLKSKCDKILQNFEEVEIVSGGCRGSDALGERLALESGFGLKLFPADWDKYRKSAGHIRNAQMADYADCLILFWDGISKGSEDMLALARKKDLKIRVIRYGNSI
jgi:hypothetical protein